MQTNKHTDGPWHYAPGELIYGPAGESVASCRFVTNYKEINVANMRLVAAAPDLLAELESIKTTLKAASMGYMPKELLLFTLDRLANDAHDAIEKAKGAA